MLALESLIAANPAYAVCAAYMSLVLLLLCAIFYTNWQRRKEQRMSRIINWKKQ